jgi:hypothetical protein
MSDLGIKFLVSPHGQSTHLLVQQPLLVLGYPRYSCIWFLRDSLPPVPHYNYTKQSQNVSRWSS